MADKDPLEDMAAYDRLHAALDALGKAPGATIHGNTALEAARRSLRMLQLGLLVASDKAAKGQSEP
ncbi:hypothetical protein [Aureimonas sp. N4]|uniref:hypothetical protein n=1 Tax=Aureimonas sp. N4 TaxID=1638165 RepID=UPI000785044F|nr:hypothetical protein [Aureimonas sp. N4]